MSFEREKHGYPCGCVYYCTGGGYVYKAEFCSKHRIVRQILYDSFFQVKP
jgi:hypothetical protein